MKTEIGEYIVGAYLKIIKECDFVDYNVRPRGGGLEGLKELDVVGINFQNDSAYLCEVTTHTTGSGLLIGDYKKTIDKISQKHKSQKRYAEKYLKDFSNHYFMFWSPFVSDRIMGDLEKIKGLELITNEKYAACISELKERARAMPNDTGNPFFRMLQITEKVNKKYGE